MLRHLQALLAHERNQQGALERAAQAQAQGLDAAQFATQFPGSTVVTTTNHTGGGYLRGALLAAGLLTAGAGAGIALKPAAGETKPPATALQPAAGATKPPNGPTRPAGSAYDAVVEEQQPDGSWKEVTRQRLTPPEK